jgi:hypothetical protein
MSLFRKPGKPRRMPLVTNSCGEPRKERCPAEKASVVPMSSKPF